MDKSVVNVERTVLLCYYDGRQVSGVFQSSCVMLDYLLFCIFPFKKYPNCTPLDLKPFRLLLEHPSSRLFRDLMFSPPKY